MDLPTLTISAGYGWLDQRDRFSANIAGKEQKNYTLLRKGELSYNHGNSKLAKYGTVFSLRTYEEALVPRVYHSFKVTDEAYADFIEYVFATKLPDKELGKLISSGARMDGLLNINYDEFMGIKITMPSVEEQKQLSEYLRHLDNLITLHQRKYSFLCIFNLQNGKTNTWEQRKLSDLCSLFTDGDWIEAKDQSTEGVRLVQTGNVGVTQYLDKTNNAKWISEDTFSRLKCEEIFEGDILISRLPDPAGRACIMPNLGTKMITAVDCTIVRTLPDVNSEYLVQYLSTERYFKEINACLAGGTRQRVSRGNLAEFDIPLPNSADEQRAIGNYFKSLDHLITLHQRKPFLRKTEVKNYVRRC